MKKTIKNIIAHLNDKSGEGYITLLTILLVIFIYFGAIFALMSNLVNARNIKQQVDAAAADVFADVKQNAYDAITDANMDFSFADLTDAQLMQMYGEKLHSTYWLDGLERKITSVDSKGRIAYTISSFTYTYIDHVGDDDGKILRGDVNGDEDLNYADRDIAEAYIKGLNPKKTNGSDVELSDVDMNNDGVANNTDISIIIS